MFWLAAARVVSRRFRFSRGPVAAQACGATASNSHYLAAAPWTRDVRSAVGSSGSTGHTAIGRFRPVGLDIEAGLSLCC